MTTSPAIQLKDIHPHTEKFPSFQRLFSRKAWICCFGLFMWRPIGWLTCVFLIMLSPSLARLTSVWSCFTTGKLFRQRLWIPEPTGNTQSMSPFVIRDLLFSLLTQILIFNIWKYYTPCIPAILIIQYSLDSRHVVTMFLSKQLSSDLCRGMSADGSNPKHRTSHPTRSQLQRHHSEQWHVGA